MSWKTEIGRMMRDTNGIMEGLCIERRALLGALVASPWLVACGPTEPLRAGKSFPGFDLARLLGGRLGYSDYAGKALLLNAWASWCGPCRQEMQQLERLSRGMVGGLQVVGMSLDTDMRLAEEYVMRERLSFPNVWEGERRFATRVLGVRLLPETFLIGADGIVAWRVAGAREWDSPAIVGGLARFVAGRLHDQAVAGTPPIDRR